LVESLLCDGVPHRCTDAPLTKAAVKCSVPEGGSSTWKWAASPASRRSWIDAGKRIPEGSWRSTADFAYGPARLKEIAGMLDHPLR
jgi:hypothetical protein